MTTAGPSRALAILPGETRSKLRSTQILTSLPQIVSELVQNALDAGARQVDIGVDCEEWTCWVRDDGVGISRDGLAVLAQGSEAGRYGTSKAYTPSSLDRVSTFGFRGEALASAADLSCLEISSRTARSRESWSVILKGGAELYSGPSVRWRRETHGTVVCVRDAFFNLPIRRRVHTPPARTLELVRKDVEAFALVSPHVGFSLENTHRTNEGDSRRGRVMTVPKTPSSVAVFRHLYGRALAEHVDEIDDICGEMKLHGFVSLEGAYSKAYQFLYINRHLLAPCDLHRAIDAQFAASSFTKHAYDEAGATGQYGTRRSPRKSEKKAVYVLNLSIPPKHVDNCMEPAKAVVQLQNSEATSAFLVSTVAAFLRRHNFLTPAPVLPHRGRSSPSLESPPPRKKRKIADNGSRAGSSHTPRPAQPPLVVHPDKDAPAQTTWTDPATGEAFVVDTRTGNSYPVRAHPASGDGAATPTVRRTLGAQQPGSARADAVPAWIRDALQANDAYAPCEPRVRAQQHMGTREGRLRAADLRAARVLGQVDRKFVACVAGGALVLVDQHAADERVRVERLQRALCAGRGAARVLRAPVPVLLVRGEADRVREKGVAAAFARWGVRFAAGPGSEARAEGGPGEHAGYAQVWVESVPEIVADKLLAGEELRELIKGYLAVLETEAPAPTSTPILSGEEGDAHAQWQKALRGCPRELLELVNSRACRGAIMFNDPLTLAQCERLVSQLAGTALPFQCAHGRPSLVPLVHLGGADMGARQRRGVDWAEFGSTGRRTATSGELSLAETLAASD